MANPRVITAPEDSDVTLRGSQKKGGKKKGKQAREAKEETDEKRKKNPI